MELPNLKPGVLLQINRPARFYQYGDKPKLRPVYACAMEHWREYVRPSSSGSKNIERLHVDAEHLMFLGIGTITKNKQNNARFVKLLICDKVIIDSESEFQKKLNEGTLEVL
jgi:hypothetical protein